MARRSRTTGEHSLQDNRVRQAGWVDLVDLVCFVRLVSLGQPNKPNKHEKQAGSRAPRATVCGAGERFQHLASLPFPC